VRPPPLLTSVVSASCADEKTPPEQALRVMHARHPGLRGRGAREAGRAVRDRAAHRQGRAVAADPVPAQGDVRGRLHRADGECFSPPPQPSCRELLIGVAGYAA
jgi:hypothetical protein